MLRNGLNPDCPPNCLSLYARWEYQNIVYRFNGHSDGSTCREQNRRAANVY